MVLLTTSDNESFTVDKEVAERSVLIKNMLEGARASLSARPAPVLIAPDPPADVGESDQPIPLPNVSSSVLKKVRIHCVYARHRA
jgi:S-phase kinase-associated protein 1